MKKVCIIGRGASWEHAPFNDPEYEIWGINDCYKFIPRADRWFEIHNETDVRLGYPDTDHINQLNNLAVPVYMQDVYHDIAKSVKFPKDEFIKLFPDWWANTLCYMFAMAIYEGFEEIYLYGVDMANPSEHEFEIPAMAKWIGYASAKNITVYVPKSSVLRNLNTLYGYDDDITRKPIRRAFMRCYAGQIPQIMDWLNKKMPEIYKAYKDNLMQIIDISFDKKAVN